EPSDTPSFRDRQNRMWGSFRRARLRNYPNEGDEPLPDHKVWLDENVVRTLRNGRALGLGCRLFGSASNDNAGFEHNLQVAERRARKAKAFLLARGVDPRQIFEVSAVVTGSKGSTDSKFRNVEVSLERPVNSSFAIRKVVLAAGTSLLPWGAVHFFE